MSTPTKTDRPCPCGTGDLYEECCGCFHSRRAAPATAATLMRSRFSAFAVADKGYLLGTWHPSTRPADLDLEDQMVWTHLEIVDVNGGGPFDTEGSVEFRAHYRIAGEVGTVDERSSFLRLDGRWLYVRGELRHRR